MVTWNGEQYIATKLYHKMGPNGDWFGMPIYLVYENDGSVTPLLVDSMYAYSWKPQAPFDRQALDEENLYTDWINRGGSYSHDFYHSLELIEEKVRSAQGRLQ